MARKNYSVVGDYVRPGTQHSTGRHYRDGRGREIINPGSKFAPIKAGQIRLEVRQSAPDMGDISARGRFSLSPAWQPGWAPQLPNAIDGR